MNEMRSIPEEAMADKAAGLVRATQRRSKQLEGWEWTNIRRTYRYGPKGTGSARSFITAERGSHGVTLEYLYRLNNRYGSPVKFLGGFWDGGPVRGEKEFRSLAMPLKSTYNHGSRTTRRSPMATATETKPAPRKRAAKKAAAEAPTNGKAPARRGRPPKAAEVVEEEFDEEVETESQSAAAKREAAERRAARKESYAENAATVAEMRAEGTGWADIAEAMETSQGVCVKMLYWHEARLADGGDIEEPTPEKIRADREAGLSWPFIECKYDISRKQGWDYLAEAGVDHFESDIGKGGRYIERDPEEVEARREASRAAKRKSAPSTNGDGAAPKRRGRPPKFKGFTDETPDEDVLNAVEGKKITWKLTRGDGTDSAVPKPGTVETVEDKRGQRGIKFSDGRKSRTVYVNKIIEIS